MEGRKKVYVETSVVGNLTARRSSRIAIAAVNEMDILVPWKCTNIANVETMPTIRQVCEMAGYRCPEICTPYFMEGGMQ